MFEAPRRLTGLDDLSVVSESVEQLGGPVRMGDPDLRDDAGEGDGE